MTGYQFTALSIYHALSLTAAKPGGRGDGCDTINMILSDNIAIVTDIFGPIYYIYQAS